MRLQQKYSGGNLTFWVESGDAVEIKNTSGNTVITGYNHSRAWHLAFLAAQSPDPILFGDEFEMIP